MGNEILSLVLFIDETIYNDYTLRERDNDELRTIKKQTNGQEKDERECKREEKNKKLKKGQTEEEKNERNVKEMEERERN